jgi:predicted  nucleic acid-binding Zn-ribbon protein
MKVLVSGKNGKPKTRTELCSCGCMFVFEASEAKYVNDPRDGDAYVVQCPECDASLYVDTKFFL